MADNSRQQELILRRLLAMGIEARVMKGSRTILASMRLQTPSLDTLGAPLDVHKVVFSVVGHDRLKCLRPRPLFVLPLLRFLDCRDATEVEACIRLAWQRHIGELRRAEKWLGEIGADVVAAEDGSLLSVGVEGEARGTRALIADGHHFLLPTRGRLSGKTLQRAEDRTLRIDRRATSSVELEMAISNRMEELARIDARMEEERRIHAAQTNQEGPVETGGSRSHQLLLVGPRLSKERSCVESLRLRGYTVITAQNEQQALAAFDETSPDLVLADADMGRNGGIELVPALRGLVGVEEIPVVLVDSELREARKEAARRVGAAGYLTHPIDVGRIANRLSRMVSQPRRRRFTRFSQRLSVRIQGTERPCTTIALGRGGMFVATDRDLRTQHVHRCEIVLPEMGKTLRVSAEALYRSGAPGSKQRGTGLRFHSFPDRDEPLLIDYLQQLNGGPPA